MKTTWTAGKNVEQKAIIKSDFVGGVGMRLRLTELLKDKIEAKRTSVRGDDNYSIPNWNLLQADAIGYEKALLEVISLIS